MLRKANIIKIFIKGSKLFNFKLGYYIFVISGCLLTFLGSFDAVYKSTVGN